MPEQSWPFHKLCFIAGGRGYFEQGPARQPLQEGVLCHIPAGQPHRFLDQPKDPMILLILCISPAWMQSSAEQRRLYEQVEAVCPPLRVLEPSKFVQTRLREELRNVLVEQHLRKPGWQSVLQGRVQLLMVLLLRMLPLRDPNNRNDLFQQSLNYLEENFFRKLRTADLAELCNVSERSYSGMFRERMGMTVTDYVLKARLAFARERLLETGDIAYAAFESGFSDLAHFYRMFKKHHGMPPGQFLSESRQQKSD